MSTHKSTVNFAYWNANGIQHKIHEVYNFMLENLIDCMCICETFCKSNTVLHAHPQFFTYRSDRPDEVERGGVLIIIRRNLTHRVLSAAQCQIVENIGVEIMLENRAFQVFSCYLPGGASNASIRQHYEHDLRRLTRKRQIYFNLGDWNSKHRLWNCTRANTAGNILFDKLTHSNFTLISPFEHTFHPRAANRQPSTLDLGITNCPHPATNIETHSLGSDHSAVSFTVDFGENVRYAQSQPRYCYSLANWDRYKVLLESRFRTLCFDAERISTSQQIDELITLLVDSMHWAENLSIPKRTPQKYGLLLPDSVKDKIAERGNVERRWQRCTNPVGKLFLKAAMNRLSREIRDEINEVRNDNWAAKLQAIDSDDNNKGLWQVNKFVKNRANKMPQFKVGGATLITPAEKSEALADTFAAAHINPLRDNEPDFTTEVEHQVHEYLSVHPNVDDIPLPNLAETEAVVQGLKNSKSPGFDKINNRLIKRLPPSGMLLLNLIITACFRLCYFPDCWKLANVIAIKKPGKNPTDPASYRPISLLSSLSKVLERVILSRLREFVEENNILPPEQHGFVRGRSTLHQLKRLTDHVKAGFALRGNRIRSTGMILMDVERAFDRVWHAGLLKKMIDFNCPRYLVSLTHSFLVNREFIVSVEGQRSTSKAIPFGLPQGAVISPTLYNIYIADAPQTILNCERGFFADDTGLWASAVKYAEINKSLRENFKRYMAYFQKWKISLNVSKTKAIFFTRRRTLERPRIPHLIISRSCRVRWESEVKYLGLKLDQKLLFKGHIQYATERVNKAIGMLYPLISRNSALSVDNKLLLYKAVIRPSWSYGCPIYGSAAATNLKRLQIAQNKVLKMCQNLHWRTNTDNVHELAGVEKVNEHILKLTESFLNRLELS